MVSFKHPGTFQDVRGRFLLYVPNCTKAYWNVPERFGMLHTGTYWDIYVRIKIIVLERTRTFPDDRFLRYVMIQDGLMPYPGTFQYVLVHMCSNIPDVLG